MRRLGLTVHNGKPHPAEARAFQKARDIHLRKTEPDIGIHFPGILEIVLQQIQNDDTAAGFCDAEGLAHSGSGACGVVQSLTEKSQVHLAVGNGQCLDIAVAVVQIGESALRGHAAAIFHHFFRAIHGDHPLRALRQQLGELALEALTNSG